MSLKIYLVPAPPILPRRHERMIPYFDKGFRILAASATKQNPPRLKKKIVELYRTLVEKIPLHERLCSALIFEPELEVFYPATVSLDEAHRSFQHFLRLQHSKNKLWFGVDSILAGLGAPLFLLPGPNFFFFFPAVRAYSHHRAITGIKAARKKSIRFLPNQPLGQFLEDIYGQPQKKIVLLVENLALELHLTRLPEFYQKVVLHM